MAYISHHAPAVDVGTLASPRARRAALTFGLLGALIAVGTVLAVAVVTHGRATRATATAVPPPPGLGQYLPTSFGSFGVRAVQTVPSGIPRGVGGLLTAPPVRLQVTVSLVNLGRRSVLLPTADFLLHPSLTSTTPVAPVVPHGAILLAGSTRTDLTFQFVVDRPTAPWLHFAPTPNDPPIFVRLARTIRPEGGGALGTHSGH